MDTSFPKIRGWWPDELSVVSCMVGYGPFGPPGFLRKNVSRVFQLGFLSRYFYIIPV